MNEKDHFKEDDKWVQQALRGEMDAFDSLVRKYMNRVYFLLFRMIRNPQDAEDLTQECFVKAYHHLQDYDAKRSKFSTWLMKIAVNLCIDEFRRNKKVPMLHVVEELTHEHETPESLYLRKETYENYAYKLDQLPANYRTALLLRFYENMSYQEIADVMGISTTSVRNMLYQARQRLRKSQEEVQAYGMS
ncbi:RNA polymerase sigma factor [Thermoflavimicrobium daqui]|jgi:RNA polymerase sigma-70 factor (ECF subfamily)|uniref:Sigma-70 family RNA polymerase sigma factor n=1 Tax=Thermoflavimicrobium daqui TaxID=2137476 RepID=A0A364K8P7_9BACL|nr:sigma-70 family RNA polymerase sigma factor [Thermoflavimicrobium daqui]RAL26676.1 hypothetical protein DL897_01090 [Thermoflavimicrobium daqui]